MKRTKHIYKRFFSLFIGQSFFVRRARLAVKVGPFSYKELFGTDPQPVKRIAPWRKVRTLIPVTTTGRVNNYPGLSLPQKQHLDAILAEANSGKTHYVGDDCPGGHHPDNPVFCPPQTLRDPMDQDHAPEKPSEVDRNGPAS